jgi:CDP-glycerol glycerophosphotransferase (TagB/SpsB family)
MAPHPNMHDTQGIEGVVEDRRFSTLEWLVACDALVTDYSAVAFDAAAADKPVYFYAPDLDDYEGARGFYLDYTKDLPTAPQTSPEEVMKQIENGACTEDLLAQFREKYIADCDQCAATLAKLVISKLHEV